MRFDWQHRAEQLDQEDPLTSCRDQFRLNAGEIYLDGNSLGALPVRVEQALTNAISQQWGQRQIRSWNEGWIDLPQKAGARIAPIIGAPEKDVICADSVSVNLFKLIAACLIDQPTKTTVVSAKDMFPTDLYIAQGLSQLLGSDRCRVTLIDIEQIGDGNCLPADTNVVVLSQVNFRSGEAYNLKKITDAAHAAGASIIWDVSHSAGVLPINARDNHIDFVVGCGYKFLNGGPGAPAFVYVREDLQTKLRQPLSGWMGHRDPFAFGNDYEPADGIDRILAGTPNILSLAALNSALEVYKDIKPEDIFTKAQNLTNFFIDCVASTCEDFEIRVITPEAHGAQVSLTHPEAYPISQALIAAGVICDFRAPNIIRFGFSPLYISYREAASAVNQLQNILSNQTFRRAQYQQGGKVT